MRGALSSVLVCGVIAALVGCGGDDTAPGLRRPGAGDPNAPGANAPGQGGDAPATPAQAACAAVAPATPLSDVVDAKDVRIVGKAVFFSTDTKVFRVTKEGKDKTEVFASPNLVRAYVDSTAMITIEATAEAPDATTLRVIKAVTAEDAQAADPPAAPPAIPTLPDIPTFPIAKEDGLPVGTTAATNFNAAGTRVFASDATSFYILADTAAGDSIIKVSKDNPGTQTTIVAATNNVITHPQIASGAVWYVRDAQRVFKVALADEENALAQGEPIEVFGVNYASVNLAVTEKAAFITAGSSVERRDLTGANATTIFDIQKSKTPARLGGVLMNAGALFVRNDQPDAQVKHVIREIKPSESSAEEKFVACGRSLTTGFDVDATSVVWTEQSGVFLAPR